MKSISRDQLHQLARSILLLGFALYIAYLARTDSLTYYIAPKMEGWLRYSTIPLTLMSLCLAYRALFGRTNELSCGCTPQSSFPRSPLRHTIIYGLFLFPLVLGTFIPYEALGSMAADKKGMALGSPLLSHEQLDGMFPSPDKYNTEFAELAKKLYQQEIIEVNPAIFSETIGAIELFKDQFQGKMIRLSGFVFHDPLSSPNDSFILGRFLVQCCTADAQPFGVLVTLPEQSLPPGEDTWIEVQGSLNTTFYQGSDKQIITINASHIREIPRPSSPYIYSSDDALKAWDEIYNEQTPPL